MERDLAFIGWEPDSVDLPKERRYLRKYFKKHVQRQFLKYFFVFGDFENFADHSGVPCTMQWCKVLHKKLMIIEGLHDKAKQDMDLEMLAKIERGKIRRNGIGR